MPLFHKLLNRGTFQVMQNEILLSKRHTTGSGPFTTNIFWSRSIDVEHLD